MADDATGTWTRIAACSEVVEGKITGVSVGDTQIALYNLGGEYYATSNLCTHAWALLSDGFIEDGEYVDCPLHFGRFEIKTGKVVCPPADTDLMTYKVRITGEDIEVLLPS
jgi:naphthalene 1,2-dioxygenase system ferredoxin subunit